MMLKIQLCITGINYILKYTPIQNGLLNSKNMLQYYCYLDVLWIILQTWMINLLSAEVI